MFCLFPCVCCWRSVSDSVSASSAELFSFELFFFRASVCKFYIYPKTEMSIEAGKEKGREGRVGDPGAGATSSIYLHIVLLVFSDDAAGHVLLFRDSALVGAG